MNNGLSTEVEQLQQEVEGLRNGETEQTGRVLFQQQSELAREKKLWKTELSRNKELIGRLQQRVETAEVRTNEFKRAKEEAEDKLKEIQGQVGEYAVKVEALEQQLQEREQMNSELIGAHAEAKLAHEKQVAELQTREGERYGRLLREFNAHREEAKQALRQQADQLEAAERENRRLQEQIATGKPDERRIFELAELQARREHKIRQVNDQMASNVKLLAHHEEQMGDYRAKIQSLEDQIQAERLSKIRSKVNLDYLKAIMVKFVQLKDDTPAQIALYPVIAKVLYFTEEEQKMVKELMKEQGIYGYVSSFIWSKENGSLMKDAPPVIETPKNGTTPVASIAETTETGEKMVEETEKMGEI